MTEQQRPDEDVEGHARKPALDAEGTEEDVEGHARKPALDAEGTEDDDVEGHSHVARRLL